MQRPDGMPQFPQTLALSHLFPSGADAALRRVALLLWTDSRYAGPPAGRLYRLLLWTVDGIMESWVPARLAPVRLRLLARQGWTVASVGEAPAGRIGCHSTS